MRVESVAAQGTSPFKEQETLATQKVERQSARDSSSSPDDKQKVPPEEVLTKIKELTQDGAYSVRFEMDDATQKLIIRLVDPATGEMIRQIPPEEILGNVKHLKTLRGNLVDSAS
ncbi:flagellar protein FlaG [Desulfuromonas sp. KJ2020]|jgi:flagellar protein FlaG|uniref:flagellar protein FlaG n=1 Tax=Desulfuromonas sp. KJ2020 TaxID=2919173 RepID=UPI000324FA7F|nr:flagellar protein FlaG [Desulfuromonas sp. KJ2020]MCP3178439.1 flagellar protein FlaG [Desulfuromonas sp. KJ2020]